MKAAAITNFPVRIEMRILQARGVGEAPGEKSAAAIQQHELSANGDVANSTERDAADMVKLGVKQETKVCQEIHVAARLHVIDDIQRRFGFWTMLAFVSTMMCSWESAIPYVTGDNHVHGGRVYNADLLIASLPPLS